MLFRSEARLQARPETDNPPLIDLLGLDDRAFRQRFAGSPIKRTGRDRFIRNCLIAAGNSGERDLLPAIERLATDASPLVRAMAAWALSQLCRADEFAALRTRHLSRESDADVRREWTGDP